MFYMLFFIGREEEWDAMERPDREKIMRLHMDQVNAANAAGSLVTSMRLMPTAAATTVETEGKRIVVRDGPFADTKEQIGGFQILDCASLDDAVRFAKMFVDNGGIRFDAIEIRPVHRNPTSID